MIDAMMRGAVSFMIVKEQRQAQPVVSVHLHVQDLRLHVEMAPARLEKLPPIVLATAYKVMG